MRRRVALVLLVLAIAFLWRPFVRPLGAGAILVTDIYSSALWDRNVAAYVTPPPRIEDGSEPIGASDMRVTWWIPGWGSLHPAVMLVNGATEKGNDDPETRRLADALARAGYMVMLPEFPFIKAGTLERDATAILDAAFARALARPETKGMHVGAFGFSVGGGMLLAAASRPGALSGASYIGALGASDYDIALERLHELPGSLREVFDSLSPRTSWSSLRASLFWLHDIGDRFEPVSEAETAAATAHAGPTRFQRTALLSHAAA